MLYLFYSKSFSQDIITRTDSVRIEATDLKVGNEQIRYRLYVKPESPEYVISTLDVLFVEYADGTRRVFIQPDALMQPAPDYETELGRNIVCISVIDIFYLNATLAYERISASGKFGIRVPLSLGLDPDEQDYGYYLRNKSFSAGIALNLYPYGQRRFNYYFGPQAELSFLNYQTCFYTYPDPDNPYAVGGLRTSKYQMVSIVLNNGIYYQLSKTVVTALDVGVGARFLNISDENDFDTYPYYINRIFVPVNLHVGLRF